MPAYGSRFRLQIRSRVAAGTLAVCGVAELVERLRGDASDAPVPLLVVRLRDLERIAWREGRPAARAVERRSLRAFTRTAARALRASDLLAHDAESGDFVAALVSRGRSAGSVATASDCRATLARLASAMELEGGMRVEHGWTLVRAAPDDSSFSAAVESALERGARERERYDFFSTVGHELRTPLTSILGYLETLMDTELDAPTARRFLEVARDEALRLGRLVEGMFELSLLDLRREDGRHERASLAASLDAACNALAPFAAMRGCTLVRTPFVDVEVALGADRITQITLNLLENAVKHGRAAGTVTIAVAELDARYVEICVGDDGPGVPPRERELIFSLGQRGKDARAPGSGLGLTFVRSMVERFGGEVDVTQSPAGGALFRVRLPRFSSRAP
ncbi:MAG: HAMP domain-containing histidine kinase [Candidatus Eremiobacteraeota bacterium]|nr:HAMP domain-containing histidine kinase [Candidatus Eremiobacteraeota bacterium]